MKKIVGIISACAIGITASSYMYITSDLHSEASSSDENKINTQQVLPKGTVHPEINVYTFEEVVKKADLIAEIEITKKVKELSEPSPKTLFEAKILEGYKESKELETIKILQAGNSEWIFDDHEPFKENEKYILFLKTAVGEEFEGTDTYWLLGANTNTYSVLNDNQIMKNALYDEELALIEDTVESRSLSDSTDIQFFNKDVFLKKLDEVITITEQ